MEKSVKRLLLAINILAFLGMIVTAYLIYQHYKPAGGSFCNVSEYVSCDVVNKSIYSELFGIPVSILGFASYVFLFLGTLSVLSRLLSPKNIISVLSWFSLFALLFSAYLTIIEFFVLKAVCLFCVTQQIIIFIISLLFFSLWLKKRKS